MSKRVNRDDIDKFHDYSLYIPSRTVYMGSETADDGAESGVDYGMAQRQIKNLHILDVASADPITIIMNNPGGDMFHGLAIYDAIKACRSHVTIKVFGHAMSMGSIILQAADTRVMAANSSQMIHYGQVSVDNEAKTTYKTVDEYKRIDKLMEKMYLSKIQKKQPLFTIARLRAMLNNDTFLTAQQSVDLGLADEILGDTSE
jgi:ATP-dependent Clp protease protease subunit